MRLGAPIFKTGLDAEGWAREISRLNYRAAYCPVPLDADTATARSFAREAVRTDILIAEVGAWSNPLSPDEKTREAALSKCKAALQMAESIGARCAVNIAGSRGTKWDGPDPRDVTDETFDLIVECVREIIDSVRPTRALYALETMPWMYPDSADSYLRLIRAIDRKAFGVHFDPVNLVSSPQLYFDNGRLIREFAAKLGPRICSCHAKDVVLGPALTVHLDEVCPGTGGLDYATLVRELNRLDPDMPLLLEHLPTARDYHVALENVCQTAREQGVPF